MVDETHSHLDYLAQVQLFMKWTSPLSLFVSAVKVVLHASDLPSPMFMSFLLGSVRIAHLSAWHPRRSAAAWLIAILCLASV